MLKHTFTVGTHCLGWVRW